MNDIAIQSDQMFPLFPESKISQNQKNIDFRKFVKDAIYRTDQRQKDANIAIQKMMNGDAGIHETMLELSKADISLKVLNQFRTKAMESYKQIMQMTF
jgi:flagellar hook-basal body complex protein FliE